MSESSKKSRAASVLRSALCVIAFILTVLFGVLSFALASLGATLLNRGFLTDTVSIPEYASELKERIDKSLEKDCSIYGIPYKVVEKEITKERLTAAAVRSASAFFDGNSDDLSSFEYPSEGICEAVKSYGKGDGADTIYKDEKNAPLLAEKLTDRIRDTILSVFDQPLVKKAASKLFQNSTLCRLTPLAPVFAAFAIAFAALTYVLKKGNPGEKLYISASALMTVGTLCFAPAFLVRLADIPSRVALGDSYIRQFFVAVAEGALNRIYTFSLVLFVFTFVILVAASVMFVAFKKKEKEQESKLTLD